MTPYPADLKPLTSLRFFAAIWVLLFHFRNHWGLPDAGAPLVANGWLGVDLFFILSGFILTHVYLEAHEAGRYDHRGFLWNRIARVYPLHLATLAAAAAIYVAGAAIGRAPDNPEAFDVADIPAHLALVHAWGLTDQVGWNFPSWSISAEWAAYLLFPAFLWATAPLKSRPLALLALAFGALALALWALPAAYGRPWNELTAQGGALRILPLFLIGVALRRVGASHALPPGTAGPVALAAAAAAAGLVLAGLPGPAAIPALALLVYALAEGARSGRAGVLSLPALLFLGEASYALYMIHAPLDIVAGVVAGLAGVDENSPELLRRGAVIATQIACVGAACLAYLLLEKPARAWLRARPPKLFTPAPAPRP